MKLEAVFLVVAFTFLPGTVYLQVAPPPGDEMPGGDMQQNVENGDINGDGSRNITDVILMLNRLFVGGPPPATTHCMCSKIDPNDRLPPRGATELMNGDIDGSGQVDVTDAVRFVNWLYNGGLAPVSLGCDAGLPN